MASDRFDKLENDKALPRGVHDALAHLARFEALEIGTAKMPVAPASSAAPTPSKPAPAPAAASGVPCVHCGQANEPQRETCWACYRYVGIKAGARGHQKAQDDITIVLDGLTYRSSDQNLPDDVRELMNRIRKRGFSQELLAEWRQWRAVRNVPAPAADDDDRVKVFQGQRVSVIRLDGKVYTSDDPDLSQDLRALFAYIEAHGVTPALMERLGAMGQVKVRPPTTAYPSDGDVDFWNQVKKSSPERPPAPPDTFDRHVETVQAELELEAARLRYNQAWQRGLSSAAGIVLFILYIVARVWLR